MATTGKVPGNAVGLYVDGSKIALSTDLSFTGNTNLIDETNADSAGWEENSPGSKAAEFSISGFVAYDANYGYEDIEDLWLAGTQVELKWTTEESGDKRKVCSANIQSVGNSRSHHDKLVFDASFKSTGPVSKEEIT